MHQRDGNAVWGCLSSWLIEPRFPRDNVGDEPSVNLGILTVSDRATRNVLPAGNADQLVWRHLRLPQQRRRQRIR